MKITKQATDEAVLSELGGRLAQVRLERNLTQAQLAEQAGVSKRTVERLGIRRGGDAVVGLHPCVPGARCASSASTCSSRNLCPARSNN